MTQINREKAPTGDPIKVHLKEFLGRFPNFRLVLSRCLGDDFEKYLHDQGYQVDSSGVRQPNQVSPEQPVTRHQ